MATPNPYPSRLMDYGPLSGGLVRMMNRFRDEGTMTGDDDAELLLRSDAAAVLLGMLYDQRVLAEYAFSGPLRLRDRIGHLDMNRIAGMDADALRETFAEKPAVHRFTNKMAEYTHAIAALVRDEYEGDPARLWNDGADADTVQKRVQKLPGFGKMKAFKFRFALHYFGWRDFAEDTHE